MTNSIHLNPQLAITRWTDDFGSQEFSAEADSTLLPAFRLLRYDDAWRPIASQVEAIKGSGSASLAAAWEEAYAGHALTAGQPAHPSPAIGRQGSIPGLTPGMSTHLHRCSLRGKCIPGL